MKAYNQTWELLGSRRVEDVARQPEDGSNRDRLREGDAVEGDEEDVTSREKLRVREPELCGTGSDTDAICRRRAAAYLVSQTHEVS